MRFQVAAEIWIRMRLRSDQDRDLTALQYLVDRTPESQFDCRPGSIAAHHDQVRGDLFRVFKDRAAGGCGAPDIAGGDLVVVQENPGAGEPVV